MVIRFFRMTQEQIEDCQAMTMRQDSLLKAIVFNDTSYDDHHGCQIVMRQIYRLAEDSEIRITQCCPIFHDWRNDASLKKNICQMDLCIINGEGSLHHDRPAVFKYLDLAEYCQKNNVPCFLINAIWQDNEKGNTKAHFFTRIFVRDKESQDNLKHAGVGAQLVPDLTLSYETRHRATIERKPELMINGSVLAPRMKEAWLASQSREHGPVRYVSIRTIPPIQWQKGFPSQVPGNILKQIKCYRHILASYFCPKHRDDPKSLSRFRWRHAILSTQRFIHALQSARGVITGRFHCVTLALVTRTPFFAIPSNTKKIEPLLNELGMAYRLHDSYHAALQDCHRLPYTPEEITRIDAYLQMAENQCTAMFREMRLIADTHSRSKTRHHEQR